MQIKLDQLSEVYDEKRLAFIQREIDAGRSYCAVGAAIHMNDSTVFSFLARMEKKEADETAARRKTLPNRHYKRNDWGEMPSHG